MTGYKITRVRGNCIPSVTDSICKHCGKTRNYSQQAISKFANIFSTLLAHLSTKCKVSFCDHSTSDRPSSSSSVNNFLQMISPTKPMDRFPNNFQPADASVTDSICQFCGKTRNCSQQAISKFANIFSTLLAHLSTKCKVSFCDHSASGVVVVVC